ncbi:DUF3995 domain-containing protein [Streptomyces sp. WAC 01529]|uniref:DUF3995 domain-containing protein n=1 Tax=Streptomyces sp. WAC 01529 TaxID=2203205 RepID=UPI000F6F5C76|nr:DUF3995 domain-containing protein [Streptomyces sp. WAC 01529]AZM52692.1 DUF3995 domain-containing protein [Streptomyces sp. WAC 01529]
MRRRPEEAGAGTEQSAALWGRIACLWATAFAGLHFYWALGGDTALSVSAGPLADERPLWFVLAGLWGVGALCLLGASLAWLLATPRLRGGPALAARGLGWGISALLLVRGIGVEVLLLTDTAQLDASVSAGQRAWTLALWNPWFIAGGLAFGLATLRSREPSPPQVPDARRPTPEGDHHPHQKVTTTHTRPDPPHRP